MQYSKFALESAVLTLLPEAQNQKDSFEFSKLFHQVTEKYFLLTEEPDPVDTACYTIVKAAISDIKSHGMLNYGKTEFAHEVSKQTKAHLMKTHYILPHNERMHSNTSDATDYMPPNTIQDSDIPDYMPKEIQDTIEYFDIPFKHQ